MLINIQRTVTEDVQVELKVPAFYTFHNCLYYAVGDDGSITTAASSYIAIVQKEDSGYAKQLDEVMKLKECTESEFIAMYVTARANTHYTMPLNISNGNAPY